MALKIRLAISPDKMGGGDASGGGFQPSGEYAEKTILLYRLLDALGKGVAEACQGDGSASPGKFRKGLIYPHRAQKHADDHVAHQNPRRSQLGFVNENLTDETSVRRSEKLFT